MQGQGEQNRCQVFPVTIGTGSKGRRSRPALTHMEDVERALRPTKLIVAQANVEDDRLLCPGQIGNAKQILGFEIGDDDRGALAQDFLRLGGYVRRRRGAGGRAVAFVAFREDHSELLGVARLAADPDYMSAEYAVIVRSDLKGAGLGWTLMQHLIRYAESEGLRDLHGDVLAANERMLKMCRELGFDIAIDPEDLALRKVRLKLPLSVGS